jgi:tetratricopeptide (TPR) repeat protein
MNDKKTGRIPLTCLTILLTLLLAASPLAAHSDTYGQSVSQASPQGDPNSQDLDKKLSIAGTRLEMIKVLVAQGKSERVVPEIKIIFQIALPDKYDGEIADAALIIAKLLVDQTQYEVAHAVLDEAFLRVKWNANKARLLQIKAGIYKLEGKLDKALATWEQALAYEKLLSGN